MSTITKSYSVDFGSNWDQSQFNNEVQNESGITPNLLRINKTGDVIDIIFDAGLSVGEQTTLDGLIATHNPVPPVGGILDNFDALVSPDGTGDYLKPSAAFAAGARTVYVRPGVYVEVTDIVIPNNGVMLGETIAPVILYFVGNVGVKIDGSGGTKETAGTISVPNGSTTVTGIGTSFLNLVAGQYILLDQNFYQIASITDHLSLELTETYNGNSLSGISYVAQAMHTAVNVSNVIITNSAGTGLYMRATRSSTIACCGVMANGGVGVEIVDSSTNAMSAVNCYDNGTHGMCFTDSYSIGLINGESYNNGSNGYHVAGNSNNIVFNGVLATNNNGNGINVDNNATNILVNDCTIKRNNSKGITTVSGTGSAVIDGSLMSFNGSDGVDFNGNNNIISNCLISMNGGRGIHAGSNGTVTGNQVFNNSGLGIDMTGDSNCQVSSNNIHTNTGDGIYIDSGSNGISDNTIRNNTGHGVHVNGGNDNDIDGNTIADNTSDGIKLVGACTAIIIASNRIKGNTIGVDIPTTSDDCVINGNIVTGNSSHGIQVASSDCIVTANRCKNNTGDGCVIVAGASDCTVKINRFTGNTGADFTDNGFATIKD